MRGPPPDDVELVVVSFRSRRHLLQLLPTLAGFALAVVDNSPGAEPLADLVEGVPRARLVAAGPGGFGAAVNLAARTSRLPYLILVNPDSRPEPEVLVALVDELRRDPTLAGVGPLTRGADGRIEIGVGGWAPSPARALVHALGLHLLLPRRGMVARPRVGSEPRVDWVSGACLAVPRETFLRLGGFDERLHVYSEDMAYGLAARRAGLREQLRTDLVVPHEGGGSGAPRTDNAWLRGQALAVWLGGNTSRRRGRAVRLALGAGMLARVPLYLATRRHGRAREALSYVRGLAQGAGADPRLRVAAPPPRV